MCNCDIKNVKRYGLPCSFFRGIALLYYKMICRRMKKNRIIWMCAVLMMAIGMSSCTSSYDTPVIDIDREIQAVRGGDVEEGGRGRTEVDKSDPLSVFFRGVLQGKYPIYYHGITDFCTDISYESCHVINSREEFEQADKGNQELPDVDFSRYTLIIGRTYGVNGDCKLEDVTLRDKGDFYELETTVRYHVGGSGTQAHVDFYYWRLYPKLEKKDVIVKYTTREGIDPALFEQTTTEFTANDFEAKDLFVWTVSTVGTWTVRKLNGVVSHVDYGLTPSPEPPKTAEEFFSTYLPLIDEYYGGYYDPYYMKKDTWQNRTIYRQYYAGIPVEQATWEFEYNGGVMRQASGHFVVIDDIPVTASISWEDAKKIVENYIHKPVDGMCIDIALMEFPVGGIMVPRLVWAYKHDEWEYHDYVYVDAKTGRLLYRITCKGDYPYI